MEKYTKINARTINRWVDDGWEWGIQFSHTLEEQIRGQIKVGFKLIDLCEDYNNEGTLRSLTFQHFGQLWLKSKLFIKLKFAVNK